jgi:predicted  nucleic acid-binding Zn-ribbon protein
MWQTLETKAKFIAQVMSGVMTIRRLEDLDSAALTYAEVKAIASGNPLVIEKAQVDAELIRLTRLRSAHAEEQYRIRSNLRRSHEDAEMFAARLTNLRQDISIRQDTSGDKFIIELEGQQTNNRGIAGELILRRAEKLKDRFGDDVRIGRFAGFDLFLRPSFNNTVEVVVRGKNSYAARVTDTAQGTIRSLETTVQGFEERAAKLETDIADANKRAKELQSKVGAPFEHEKRYQDLNRRQSEIEEKLDLTKNQAPSQVEADSPDDNTQKNSQTQEKKKTVRQKRSAGVTV